MHQRSTHPTDNPETNGRAARHVTATTAIRSIRLDRHADLALAFCKAVLAGAEPRDIASTSLVVRRAIQHYWSHLQAVRSRFADLEAEKATVRHLSHIPKAKKPKASTLGHPRHKETA